MSELTDPAISLGTHAEVLASILVPMVLATALWVIRPPDRAGRGALLLATCWNAVGLLALNVYAVRVGWWAFGDVGPAVVGVPVTLWLGWSILCSSRWSLSRTSAPRLGHDRVAAAHAHCAGLVAADRRRGRIRPATRFSRSLERTGYGLRSAVRRTSPLDAAPTPSC